MSSYATPATTSSTPGTTLSQPESISSGHFFSTSHQFARPPPAAATTAAAPPLGSASRPLVTHDTSSTTELSNRMVFLEELGNQERALHEQRLRDALGAEDSHHSNGSSRDRTGPGGATFLSDEETNASDAGSAFDRTPATLEQRRLSSSLSAAVKGKGKEVDESLTPEPVSATKKKPLKSKKQTIGPDGKPITRERKKKAGRACAACQKAHLTCDDGRPCARCIKKGCPEDCVDGARKKAKYLQEVPDELLERGRHSQAEDTPNFTGGQLLESPSAAVARLSQSPNPIQQSLPSGSQAPPASSQPIFDFSSTVNTSTNPSNPSAPSFYDPNSFLDFAASTSGIDHTQFGSEAANLEYAILSSMLNGNGFALDAHAPNLGGGIGGGMTNNFDARFAQNGRLGGEDLLLGGASRAEPTTEGAKAETEPQSNGGEFGGFEQDKQDTEMFAETAGPSVVEASRPQPVIGSGVPGLMTAEESLRSVTKPYPYAQSYHFLVKHLKTRFEKNDILRIVRALATFRPSLIALQMPLTEEDETFVERTFQRTLVELNKLISFSGTPTVVWRRTGEICLVGTEFCLLTGWKREELVGTGNVNGVTTTTGGRAGGGKYIFELFDTASVVEYYESFAKHAFESTSTSVTLQCVVLGPDGRPVPCAFCFSVRRDLFSCPFLIIGSFLPILV
ncbi:uncharacterized protein JCM15063_004100 [Sporobolomyces koalae]|uniref:uncharacterized protein n=1 Tax=Sporobolomyces koalae TaxID=500713 RepID=UPI00317DFBD9